MRITLLRASCLTLEIIDVIYEAKIDNPATKGHLVCEPTYLPLS